MASLNDEKNKKIMQRGITSTSLHKHEMPKDDEPELLSYRPKSDSGPRHEPTTNTAPILKEEDEIQNKGKQRDLEGNSTNEEAQQPKIEKSGSDQLYTQRLEQENAKLSEQVENLLGKNSSMGDEIKELRQDKVTLEQEIEQLQQQMQKEKNTIFAEQGSVIVSDEERGRGAWGNVCTGYFYGTKVAVKQYYEIILSEYNYGILRREIYIASQCRHPNLLQFICATENKNRNLLIVTELMDMTLRELLEKRAETHARLTYQELKSISLDVACGLNYLHSKKPNPIIHRDISSANVLLFIENNAVRRAKISDYGSANFMLSCNTPFPGAANYAAPEARRAQHDPKIDVFSYGILVCEMSICEFPDPPKRTTQIRKIPNASVTGLVKKCTKEKSEQRPTMETVIDHLRNKLKP